MTYQLTSRTSESVVEIRTDPGCPGCPGCSHDPYDVHIRVSPRQLRLVNKILDNHTSYQIVDDNRTARLHAIPKEDYVPELCPCSHLTYPD